MKDVDGRKQDDQPGSQSEYEWVASHAVYLDINSVSCQLMMTSQDDASSEVRSGVWCILYLRMSTSLDTTGA